MHQAIPSSYINESPREFSARLVHQFLESYRFPAKDLPADPHTRPFVTEVTLGIMRELAPLRWMISKLSRKPPTLFVESYLLCALYEIFYMRQPALHAIVNETVDSIKPHRPREAGFVNALLRAAIRQKDDLLTRLAAQPDDIRWSHPAYLVERWIATYGRDKAEAMTKWDNQPAGIIVRINPYRTTMEAFSALLKADGITSIPHKMCPELFLTISRGIDITRLPGFRDGLFWVQDPATHNAFLHMDIQPDQQILDACAAPGGKSLAIAAALKESGALISMDVHEDRLPELKQNFERIPFTNVSIIQGDAARPEESDALKAVTPDGGFDRILLDVPCSNSGVLQRRPDARWRFSANRLKKLVKRQRRILSTIAPLVKIGGTIVYSTCSIDPEENEKQIETWLAANPAFACIKQTLLLPGDKNCDGSYAATLQRNA